MKTKWREIIAVVIALLAISLVVNSFAVWDATKPADSDAVYTWPAWIRANWESIEGGSSVNVINHGADPTGVDDSTTEIQAAIDAANTANAVVYFPPGTYKITDILVPNARAYVGDGGDGTLTVIKQYTANKAIFEYASLSSKRFEGLTFDTDVDGVYAFKQTTPDAYTTLCIWRECYFAINIERCIHANLIFATFETVRFGWDGTVNGNGIHTAIFSHGTAARETNANNFYNCTFHHGKGGNGYIDISRGIGWQFYSCTFEHNEVAVLYAKDLYSLSFPNCYFEQRTELGSGQNYLIYLGTDGIRDTAVTMFSGIFVTLVSNIDIDHFIELGHADSRVAFGKGGFMMLGNKDLTNYAGTANYGIESIDSIVFVGFDDKPKRFGHLQTGNIILRAGEENANTLVQSLDFENTHWGHFANSPFASIRAHTSDTGDFNYDSSEMSFHTVESQTNGMKERLRIDSLGMLHNKQETGDVVLFTHQEDSLADDAGFYLPLATSGMVFVSCNAEAGMWLVQNDATVTKISGSVNTADTDSDGNLCVLDGGGTRAFVRNRLGATGEIRVFYYHQ